MMKPTEARASDVINRYRGLAAIYRLVVARDAVDLSPDETSILSQTGYITRDVAPTGTRTDWEWRNKLLSALERFDDFLFLKQAAESKTYLAAALLSPQAFGLDTSCDKKISAGGRGLSFQAAFEGCICEAVERLSVQDFDPHDPCLTMSGANVLTGQLTDFPKDQVVRRSADLRHMAEPPSSAGCGVASTFKMATESGLLELVERDAAALWWFGGRRGVAAHDLKAELLAPFADHPDRQRERWLMELTTDIGVPVMAALSADKDGCGVIVASACGWTRQSAAAKAALELNQMEMAAALALGKRRALGEELLRAEDWLWINRLDRHDTKACSLFRPQASDRRNIAAPAQSQQELVHTLQRLVGDAYVFDLTRPALGIPCARIIVPNLQAMKTGTTSQRLEIEQRRNSAAQEHQMFGPPPI